jgi:hypothetical protein
MANKQKYTARCHGVGDDGTPCLNVGNCARGYCDRCYNILRKHCKQNGSWMPGMEIPRQFEPWSYEGDQEALIKMVEKQDREKPEV